MFGPYGANPELKPEESNTQEAGLHTFFMNKRLTVSVNGFNRNINNVIIYGFDGYENLNKQHDYGVQTEVNYTNNKLRLGVSYAYIDGKLTDKISGKDTSYYNLVRRPKHAVKLFGGYNITPSLYVSTTVQFTGKRTDNYFDPNTFISSRVDLNAYTLWNVYAQYSFLKKRINVFVDVKNITNNTDYYEVYGYAVQGTTVNAGLHFKL